MNMNLNQVQTIYYILYAMQFKTDKKKDFSLIVNHKGKILTAEFLPMNKSKTHIFLEEFDYDFDVRKETVNNCLAKELYTTWVETTVTMFYSSEKAFSHPDLLLKKLIDFVSENSSKFEGQKAITNIVKNVHFLESNTKLDFMLLNDDNFEILSIKLADESDATFIEY